MTVKRMHFRCPLCTSDFTLEKKAVRSETFRCPVCQEGEIESGTAELDNDWLARTLLDGSESWVVLPAPVETGSRS